MKKIIILFSMLFLLNACDKDENNPVQETETFNLTTETISVLPFKIVVLQSNDMTFNEDTYEGLFGDVNVTLTKNSNNDLVFIVPNIQNGNYNLKLTINEKIGELSFNLEQANIQDVNTVLEEELLEPLNLLTQDVDNLIADGNISNQNMVQLNSSKIMLNNYLTQFATLSVTEKTEVAEFLKANPIFSRSIEEANRIMNGNDDFDCFKTNANRVILATATVVLFVLEVLPAVAIAGPFGSIAAIAGTIVGVYAAYTIISSAHQHLLNDCFRPFEHLFEDDLGNINNFTVENNSSNSISILSKIRGLMDIDIDDDNELVALVSEKSELIASKWNEFREGINSIISDFSNWFNGWFSSSTTYEPITSAFPELPSTANENEIDGKNEFIIVDGLPSDVQIELQDVGENGYNIKFIADESTLPRSFIANIKYDDGDFQTTDSFNVNLEEENNDIDLLEVLTNQVFWDFVPDNFPVSQSCFDTSGDLISSDNGNSGGPGSITFNEDFTVSGNLFCDFSSSTFSINNHQLSLSLTALCGSYANTTTWSFNGTYDEATGILNGSAIYNGTSYHPTGEVECISTGSSVSMNLE